MDQKVSPPRQVAIIGGGWAGLAAAVELGAAGVGMTLFESARQLGGRARSVVIDGRTLDNGQHILLGAYRETLRLMRQVGAEPAHTLRRLPLELRQDREGFRLRLPRLPAPLHLACGLAFARGLPLREKLDAVRFMRRLQADAYRLPTDTSVSAWLERHGQNGVLRQLMWEPLCLAALNTRPENASAQVFANVLRDSLGGERSDTDLLLPTVDLDRIFPTAAAKHIEAQGGTVHLGTRVRQIDRALTIEGQRFDRIILATAPRHAIPLLAAHPETKALADLLAGYAYEPIGCAYLAYPEEITLPFPMLGLDRRTGGQLGQWVFDRGAPGLLSFILSANGDWDRLDDDTLCARLHHELEATLGRPLPAPRWQRVLRERRASFSCRPNLPRPAPRTDLEGLWLAGDYVYADYPGTLEGAVRSGIAAARGCLSGR